MKKVLLIDDDDDILIEVQEVISGLGFACYCAASVDAAIGEVKMHPDLDLIISDLRLPDQSGLRLLQLLAAETTSARSIPVIITSGHADRDDVVNLFRNGAVDFLPKPIHYEHLVALLGKMFPTHQMT